MCSVFRSHLKFCDSKLYPSEAGCFSERHGDERRKSCTLLFLSSSATRVRHTNEVVCDCQIGVELGWLYTSNACRRQELCVELDSAPPNAWSQAWLAEDYWHRGPANREQLPQGQAPAGFPSHFARCCSKAAEAPPCEDLPEDNSQTLGVTRLHASQEVGEESFPDEAAGSACGLV